MNGPLQYATKQNHIFEYCGETRAVKHQCLFNTKLALVFFFSCYNVNVKSCPLGAMSHFGTISPAILPMPTPPTLSRGSSCVPVIVPSDDNKPYIYYYEALQTSDQRNSIVSTRPTDLHFLRGGCTVNLCHFASRVWVIGNVGQEQPGRSLDSSSEFCCWHISDGVQPRSRTEKVFQECKSTLSLLTVFS